MPLPFSLWKINAKPKDNPQDRQEVLQQEAESSAKRTPERSGLFTFGDKLSIEDYDIDIVAVHGLGGNWEKTWTAQNGKLWLRDFLPYQLRDANINARIMSYGYNSDTAFSKAITNIKNEAEALLDRLDGNREQKEKTRPVLFIAHSLGGLVVKNAIILASERESEYGDLLKSIRGCIFLGVPHRGANIAYWADFLAKLLKYGLAGYGGNTVYLEALKRNSKTLRDISEKFVKPAAALKIRTFYETEKLGNILIVDENSARLNIPNERAVGVAGSNHRTMCKFGEADSQRYEPVWKAVKQLAQDAIGDSTLSPVNLSAREIECLRTLCTSDYQEHKERNPDRVLGTCEWFLGHRKYLEWRETQDSCLLWISADPGCGKSILAKFLVDKFKCNEPQSKSLDTICYFFFKDDNDKQRNATFALCALVHQLFATKNTLIRHAMSEFVQKGERITREFGTLWNILTMAVADKCCGNVICIIDGLDECEASSRDTFMKALAKFYKECTRQDKANFLKFIVTSRPYLSIQDNFHHMPTIRLKAEDETNSTREDIELVVKAKVEAFGVKRCLSVHVQSALIERLISSADRTFLWVSLILRMIENSAKVSQMALDDIISNFPPTLDAVYEKILMQSSNLGDARKLLHIVVAAARPLSLEEMNVVFAIKSNDKSKKDLNLEPSIGDTIRHLCGLFVRVIDSKVYLVHQTAKEFLIKDPTAALPRTGLWRHSLDAVDSNVILAERCIWYLLFSDFGNLPFISLNDFPLALNSQTIRHDINQYTEEHCFLDYAATRWCGHYQKARTKDETISELATDVCDARSKRYFIWSSACSKRLITETPTDLMMGSLLGLDGLVEQGLQDGKYLAANDDGYTAELEVALYGDEAVAKQLLENEAQFTEKQLHGWTSLDPSICTILSAPPEACKIQNYGEPGFSRTSKATVTINGETKDFFLKTGPIGDMFKSEHMSLQELHSIVPSICPVSLGHGKLSNSPGYFLLTEFINMTSSSPRSGVSLPQKLAQLHTTPAPIPDGYSQPIFGFPVSTFCGSTLQKNEYNSSWADFYAENRLRSITKVVEETKGQDNELSGMIEKIISEVVPRLLRDGHLGGEEGVTPVLIHGDLWNGNRGQGEIWGRGIVEDMIFDPSSCYTHSEYEIGIMKMFGGFSAKFFDEYHQLVPRTEPEEEYEDRVELYQVYHYLNSYTLYGAENKDNAMAIMKGLYKKYGSGN